MLETGHPVRKNNMEVSGDCLPAFFKISYFVFNRKKNSNTFGTSGVRVNDDRIFSFG